MSTRFSFSICVAMVTTIATLAAAPQQQRYGYGQDQNDTREMRDSIEGIRHEVNNHESEIRTFENKLNSHESIIESMRDQLETSTQASREFLKGSSADLEMKINSLDTASKTLTADLKQLKTHANDSVALIAQCKQKIAQLEKIAEVQTHNLDNLQSAVRSLMDVLDVKGGVDPAASADASGKTYQIKAGDSLDKIAKAHQTTVKALKELNALASDRIVVGKTLKIP